MRVICVLAIVAGLQAEPLRWMELTPPMRALLAQAGLAESEYSPWQTRHNDETRKRLAAGAAEHIAYFLLQTRELASYPPSSIRRRKPENISIPCPASTARVFSPVPAPLRPCANRSAGGWTPSGSKTLRPSAIAFFGTCRRGWIGRRRG